MQKTRSKPSGKVKPMNIAELEQIELREGDAERFRSYAKTIVSVPKAEIDRREAKEQKTKKKSR